MKKPSGGSKKYPFSPAATGRKSSQLLLRWLCLSVGEGRGQLREREREKQKQIKKEIRRLRENRGGGRNTQEKKDLKGLLRQGEGEKIRTQ